MVPAVLIERFNAKWERDAATGCWLWTASTHSKGYGQIKWPKQRWQIPAHRLSFLIHKGEIPDGLQVCHTCDNPRCVNPEHLFAGTSGDNHADMVSKDRHLKGERSPRAKLDDGTVREILQALQDGKSQRTIASMYGVGQMTISRIKRGERWAHLNPEPAPSEPVVKKPLSEKELREVKKMIAAGLAGVLIAKAFGISPNTVSRIKRGRRWVSI